MHVAMAPRASMVRRASLILLALPVAARPSADACPPSCANNELLQLLDQFCSDKGTFWQSKHHYGTAYHSIFGSIRHAVSSILEIGIGEDTAPSVQAWATYFPNAHIYPVDIKTRKEVKERAKPGGATDKLIKHQAQFGCEYNRSMWDSPRVHLTLETDASNPEQLKRVPLPQQLDIILDDGSHKYLDQQRTLHTLWERLRPGGFYIIEDMLVGALPWDQGHAKQVPTKNADCGVECFFPQRIAEHPFLFDRFGHLKGPYAVEVPLERRTQELLKHHDWFWVVTGVHKGGGLDCSMVIRKTGPPIGAQPPPGLPMVGGGGAAGGTCGAGCVDVSVLRGAQKALLAAQALQAKLQARQEELAAKLARAEGGGEMEMGLPEALEAPTKLRNWPLLVVLAASLAANVWLMCGGGGGSGPKAPYTGRRVH